MKTFYYVVGIAQRDIDYFYPVMAMLGGFFASDYAHNARMYTDKSPYKLIAEPVWNKAFDDNPDGKSVHVFKVEGSETFMECFRQYLFEGKAWERWKVTPYFRFEKGENGEIVPQEWFDEAFRQYLES